MSQASPTLRELFAAARELPIEQRQAWLETNCADTSLRSEVEELLRFDIDDAFLEKPLVEPIDSATTQAYQSRTRDRDNMLLADRYRLLQKIGEGGFGVVYMAEQLQPVRRRVAVKLLRAALDSPSALARFESERQALAVMDHPNIARVFDGGIACDGTPYFVMELVNGVPITAFCDANRLDNAQRMQLMLEVCSAVQHAHHKGIIHRDLKPSNILVSLLDGKPIPKVIDFGIAKAIHGPLTDRTLVTAFQQMIGTPEYMSPEQAETSILDVDTRSDVYSLGVVIYELLTGTTPLDGRSLRKLGLAEIQRTIREIEPPRPSDRLSTLGAQASAMAPRHGVSPANVIKMIRGDLDWIVMKALEKDRQRRYSSAQALADDVGRWLHQEPIEARPPSVIYRTTKFVRKHRAKILLAMVGMIGLVLSAIGFGYGWSERNASIQRQADAAERASELEQLAALEADRNASLRYGNAMMATGESLRSGRRQTTLELLAECPQDKRGVEWRWLSTLASDRTHVLQSGTKTNAQTALAYSANNHHLFSASADGMVRLWNTATHQELQSWRVADERIVVLQCSATGQELLIGTESGHISVFDVRSGTMRSSATSKVEGCVAAVFEPANDSTGADTASKQAEPLYAVGTQEGAIVIWSGSLANQPRRIESREQPIRGAVQSLQFSPDGQQLLAAGKAGVRLFNTVTGDVLQTYGEYWQTYGAIFADNLNRIIFYGPSITTVDAQTFDQFRSHEIASSGILQAAYSPRDKAVVFATEDQCMRRVNLNTGVQETLGYCHAGAIVQLAAAPDGQSLAIIDDAGSLRVLDESSYACPSSYAAFDCEVASIVARSAAAVYALSTRGELVVWNAQTKQELARKSIHSQQGFSLALDKSSSRLISNGLDQRLRVWSTTNLQEQASYELALDARYVASHPDGNHLAGPMPKVLGSVAAPGLSTPNPSANLAWWNLETGRVERCFGSLSNWAMKLAFSHRGTQLAAATVSDGAVVWSLDVAEPVRLVASSHAQVDQVAFSNDDKYLFAAYRNGQVFVWNIALRRVERRMVCHGDQLTSLLVSQDGTRLITSSASDSIIRVWDWQSGQKVAEFDSGLTAISDLTFTDDQHSLLVGGKDGRIAHLRFE